MVASQAEQDDAVLRSSFRRLDLNGDQFVTFDEIATSLTQNEDALHRIGKTQGLRTEIQNWVNAGDTDGNKKLDEAEFIRAMKRFAVPDAVDNDVEEDSEAMVDEAVNKYG